MDKAFAAGEPCIFERGTGNDLLSQPGTTAPRFERKPDARQHAIFGRVSTKPSSTSVPQTIDGLRRLIADRGFTVFNVIDHSGVAERAGVQMPDSKLVMFGKPTGILVCRWLFSIPVLAPHQDGASGDASTAGYAIAAADAALVATAVMHLLLIVSDPAVPRQ